VLEFNVRFGDPEAQVVLARLESDLLDGDGADVRGRARRLALAWDPRPAVCVVLVAEGYPGSGRARAADRGPRRARGWRDGVVFHAGTRAGADGGRAPTAGACSA
jgi:phosphoribosylamine--glycine ligase